MIYLEVFAIAFVATGFVFVLSILVTWVVSKLMDWFCEWPVGHR